MKHLAFALLIGALAGPANALSCMRPDVARAFQWASGSEDTYVGLLGSFDFAPPPAQGRGNDMTPQDTRIPARFSGQGLSAGGFGPTGLTDVTLVLECYGPWCGSLTPGERVLAFARRTDNGYEVSVDPCYSTVFPNPTPQDVSRVETCMQGGRCEDISQRR